MAKQAAKKKQAEEFEEAPQGITPIPTDAFEHVGGVSPRMASGLLAQFGSWEDLRDVEPEVLLDMQGMDAAVAGQLKDLARSQIANAGRKVVGARKVAETYKDKDKDKGAQLYVLTEQRIDGKTKLRSRVLLSPGVCDECGFDLLRRHGIDKPWDKLSETNKTRMLDFMREHKRLEHSRSMRRVLSKAEMDAEAREAAKFHGSEGEDADEESTASFG